MSKIKVAVSGANGKMGQEVLKMVINDPELELVAAIDLKMDAIDVGLVLGMDTVGINFENNIEQSLMRCHADVLIDFTNPQAVHHNIKTAIQYGVYPVVGTTGLQLEEIKEFDRLLKERELGGIFAPNFAIGAILMMRFAEQAAKYMPHVEIIELHHDQKIDAPSGTALKTAEMIKAQRKSIKQGLENEYEKIPGSRGGEYDGFRIHSVRLPGFVAHQEVIFGSQGQVLSIKHDSIHRESFMPGVNLAVKKVKDFVGAIYGLENLID
ncbi:4-hydroxy-tetrahydrodipicolinate reductase [Desulfuribacillus stibiiarsenatis]|uniref:4-hydroxy-tetrahydrodipicolinate reductase n=1 Tax=Desulfuribacillus stibiiarsenatis TaxID=1390249 RepID=A0A1E5L3Z1_9FIRM|nr:4-hydroxy-tetrahydrodipicolinate reductase [Desulfuribacillus stibiiarsenatis]OEH84827.1 4-hydroxy-tetrahydrodipicolinate reductase [Desulfuribacillus stibiiarsenatis]